MGKKVRPLDEKGYPKFGMRDKLAYAAGDLGCNMSFALKGTVQTFWLVYMINRIAVKGNKEGGIKHAVR